ncbi:MAG: radical SAM protein [Deltaproteobacteria bacterium]|nr:radical SAM protein [Deltaproteobacteria bacterium]
MASPETIRLSIAAAMTLGLKPGKFYRNARLGCINLLMEYDNGCRANCLYCGQAGEIVGGADCKSLIRVNWPSYPLSEVIKATNKAAEKDSFIQRVCVSTITSPKVPEDLVKIVREVKAGTGLKVSTLITPTLFKKKELESVKVAGAENITIAVDTATPELFDKLRGKGARGPHRWERYIKGIREAVAVAGNGSNAVGVHLIIGMGETEEEAVKFIQACYDLGARVHLFSFYPEKSAVLKDRPQPSLARYRRIQLARYLIDRDNARFETMKFDFGKLVDFGPPESEVLNIVRNGTPFMTTGCSGCNRPYANETPTQAMKGLFRNYPFPPNTLDIQIIMGQMETAIS